MPLEFGSESIVASSPVGNTVTSLTELLHEGETSTYSVQLTGPGGAAIADTQFSAITLIYLDEETRSIINTRGDQDVLNLNDHTLSATALLTWLIQAEDTVMVDPTNTRQIEYHRAVYKYEFDIGSGPEIAFHEVRFPVRAAFSAGGVSFT